MRGVDHPTDHDDLKRAAVGDDANAGTTDIVWDADHRNENPVAREIEVGDVDTGICCTYMRFEFRSTPVCGDSDAGIAQGCSAADTNGCVTESRLQVAPCFLLCTER